MTDPRTADGARDTIALLEALLRNDIVGAHAVLDHCDPAPTIFALASAWIALVEMQRLDSGQLIADMRRSLP